MNPSLCVVLPVRDVEASLWASVTEILQELEQAKMAFEVLLIDNGSRDDTYDVACDLARRYPQIQVHREGIQRGLGTLRIYATANTEAEWICFHRGIDATRPDEILLLWQLKAEKPVQNLNAIHLGGRHIARTRSLQSRALARKKFIHGNSRPIGFELYPREGVEIPSAQPSHSTQFANHAAIIARSNRDAGAAVSQRQLLRQAAAKTMSK